MKYKGVDDVVPLVDIINLRFNSDLKEKEPFKINGEMYKIDNDCVYGIQNMDDEYGFAYGGEFILWVIRQYDLYFEKL